MASPTMKDVMSISLKSGSDGNVFATADLNGALRIFDIRRSTSSEFNAVCKMMQTYNCVKVLLNFLFCNLYKDEQEINFNFLSNFVLLRFVFSFDGTTQTRFDGKGKRLLCKQFSKAPIVYDVPSEQQQQRSPGYVSVTDKVELTDPGYSAIGGFSYFCFAGVDDELVVTHWIIV